VDELRVAIVGSGPAGIYAAAALTGQDGLAVDVIDRLPTPFGLVRYGVAPDHEKMKSVAVALRKVLEHERVRFLGNVEFGADVTVADLRRHYDAVVVAAGAAVDRRLDIGGEDLPGSFSATEFVSASVTTVGPRQRPMRGRCDGRLPHPLGAPRGVRRRSRADRDPRGAGLWEGRV
jgi:ferredoxin/flavodoxin---NADP+ reductase